MNVLLISPGLMLEESTADIVSSPLASAEETPQTDDTYFRSISDKKKLYSHGLFRLSFAHEELDQGRCERQVFRMVSNRLNVAAHRARSSCFVKGVQQTQKCEDHNELPSRCTFDVVYRLQFLRHLWQKAPHVFVGCLQFVDDGQSISTLGWFSKPAIKYERSWRA